MKQVKTFQELLIQLAESKPLKPPPNRLLARKRLTPLAQTRILVRR